MSPDLVLAISLVLIPSLILAWDYRLYHDETKRNSISQSIIDASKKSGLLPWVIGLGMGLLAGHLWG